MQLLTIRAAGFTAAVDAFAQDGEQLWFLSMLGSQQSVRALWARLVKGETAYLSEGDLGGGSPCWLAREAWGTWRFHGARVPASPPYQRASWSSIQPKRPRSSIGAASSGVMRPE